MAKLTDIEIRNWIRTGTPQARSDGGGLTFTLSAKGTAAWVFRYRYGGKARELTLGRYPDIGLARARELATAARAPVQHALHLPLQPAGSGPASITCAGKLEAISRVRSDEWSSTTIVS